MKLFKKIHVFSTVLHFLLLKVGVLRIICIDDNTYTLTILILVSHAKKFHERAADLLESAVHHEVGFILRAESRLNPGLCLNF